MTVTSDAVSTSTVGRPWFALSHSQSTAHTATGANLWAVIPVLVRRNERINPAVSVTYGSVSLSSAGRVWLNNLPPGHSTHSFVEFFHGRVPAGETSWTVTVSSGVRFVGEYRAQCRTYTDVSRAGAFTAVFGDNGDDLMGVTASSQIGRRLVVAFAHQDRSAITDFSGDDASQLDLFLGISRMIVGDEAGAASVAVSAKRRKGRQFCGGALDLIEHVDSNAAQITVTGATPDISVDPSPPVSTVTVPVLTLAPAFNQMNPKHLRGELFRYPYVPVKIPYTNLPFEPFANGGRKKLDSYLHRYAGQRILVLGHSEGGQVIHKWLRENGPTSDIDPSEVTFICTGNLERKYNGFPGGGDYPGGAGGTGLPVGGTPYRVIDIARQYDFWADHPDDVDNEAAMANVDPDGSGYGFLSPVHGDYSLVSANPDDARNFSITEDTVTYVWSPTYPAPLVDVEDFFTTTTTLIPRDEVVREEIEAAYTRPVVIPDPPPGGALTGDFPWGWNGSEWVRVSKESVDVPKSSDSWWLED